MCISQTKSLLEQIQCQPPLQRGNKKNHCSYKLSCVVLSHPRTLPSHHRSSSFYPSSCSGFLTLRFLPTPQPSTPSWPPFDPLLPPIHPSPSLSPGQAHSSQPFVPSSPSLLLHLCLPLPLCVRGQQRERETGEGGCRGGESERQELEERVL